MQVEHASPVLGARAWQTEGVPQVYEGVPVMNKRQKSRPETPWGRKPSGMQTPAGEAQKKQPVVLEHSVQLRRSHLRGSKVQEPSLAVAAGL